MALSVGLPRMHKEEGERRDFLPDLVAFLDRIGASQVVVEEGYGSGMGLSVEDYLSRASCCRVGSYDECLAQDVVVVIRYPSDDAIEKLRRGAILVTMVHYPTRPGRVHALSERGIRAVSMDSIVDDGGRRLVESLESVGWGGVRAGFAALRRTWPEITSPGRRAARVLVLGAGAVGAHAMRAAIAYGDRAFRQSLVAKGVRGVECTVVDHDLTGDEEHMRALLAKSDMVVDATLRPDPSRAVIPNAWIAGLPEHAVLVDLSVDPYDFSRTPPQIKGIEGVPEGNLDQYEFAPDDPVYERMDPRVDTRNRRTALSCYSWPGVTPRGCMEIYGAQIEPVLRVLLDKGVDRLDARSGSFFERAVARAEVMRWRRARRP